jgi:putative FmdB family regulatory protein
MPLYEYECAQCRKHTEKIQKFSDAEITVCPYCSGRLERVITAPSVQFKDGGWFSDGYASAKGGAKSEGSNSTSESSAAPASAPSESKAAAPAAAPAAASTTSSDKK